MSIGISSMHHSHASDAENLVRSADHALYDMLVLHRGWTEEEFRDWLSARMRDALLAD